MKTSPSRCCIAAIGVVISLSILAVSEYYFDGTSFLVQLMEHIDDLSSMTVSSNDPTDVEDILEDRFDLVHVHIAKTGGTFIEGIFQNVFNIAFGPHFWPWLIRHPSSCSVPEFDHRYWVSGWKKKVHLHCSPWHTPFRNIYPFLTHLADELNSSQEISKISTYETLFDFYYSRLYHCYEDNERRRLNDSTFRSASLNLTGLPSSGVFTIVRNPYARFVSQFHHQAGFNPSMKCLAKELNAYASKVLTPLMTNRNKITFGDCHFVPQSWYTHLNETSIIEHVIRMESFVPDLLQLLNKFRNTRNILNETHLQSLRKNLHQPPSRCHNVSETHLNEHSLSMLNVLYQDDFRLLGYQITVT